ncbi:MAG TPA: hypothetical protein VLZ30_05580 [Verrucomicrobiae bacterium]|nr:hypothetical protein [Verrucomicrobiae bacterium]
MEKAQSSSDRLSIAIVLSLLLISSLVFSYQTRHGQHWSGWKASVLRTWREAGYWTVAGKPVTNPGGVHAGDAQEIYAGYRAYSLLPLYWTYLLTNDLSVALVVLYFLLVPVLVLTIWWFLGKGPWALLIGSLFCLSPGYLRSTVMDWDPVAATMLLGIPFILALVNVVGSPPRHRAVTVAVIIAVAVYAQIEWATFFDLGVGWAACALLLWPTRRRQLGLLTVFIICLTISSAVVLLLQKSGGGSGVAGKLSAYTIGAGGYDQHGMSWSTAVRRIGVASAVGLLPLWAVFFFVAIPVLWKTPRQGVIACLPLVAAGMEICALRNDMANHQWIPIPVEALGIILSLYFLRRGASPGAPALANLPRHSSLSFPAIPWLTAGSILYTLVVLLAFRASGAETHALISLVDTHTPRHAIVFIGPDLEHLVASKDLGGIIDRKILPMDTPIGSNRQNASGGEAYVLNSAPLSDVGPLVAQSTTVKGDAATALVTWYRQTITHKTYHVERAGTFYLYKLHGD